VQRRNRYYERSRISEYKFRLLTRYFALDLEADESYFGPRRVRGKRGRGA
jgi:hypothetical protein